MIELTTLITHAVGQFLNSNSDDPEELVATIEGVLVVAYGLDHFTSREKITTEIGEPLKQVVVAA